MVNDTFSLIIKLSNYIYCIARSDQAIKPKTYKVTVKASQHISENTKVYKQNEEKKIKKKNFLFMHAAHGSFRLHWNT